MRGIRTIIYGDSEDKDSVVLQGVWKRKSEVDGEMPCMRRMEYYGGRDSGDRKERCSGSLDYSPRGRP